MYLSAEEDAPANAGAAAADGGPPVVAPKGLTVADAQRAIELRSAIVCLDTSAAAAATAAVAAGDDQLLQKIESVGRERFADVYFETSNNSGGSGGGGGEKTVFAGHRALFAARSSVFERLLYDTKSSVTTGSGGQQPPKPKPSAQGHKISDPISLPDIPSDIFYLSRSGEIGTGHGTTGNGGRTKM